MPVLMDESGSFMHQILTTVAREASRTFFSRLLSRSKIAEAHSASREAGDGWESSVFESKTAASKVADELFARGIACKQRDDILSYPSRAADTVEGIGQALGVKSCRVPAAEDRVAGVQAAREAFKAQNAPETGELYGSVGNMGQSDNVRRWTRISVEDPDFAKQFAVDLREAHIEADCAGSDVVFPESHLRAVQAYCTARGGKYPGIVGIEGEMTGREPLVRPATQRQAELMERLAKEGRIPTAEIEAFRANPTFEAARGILNARSGQVIDPMQGAKDTDRDRIPDTNEDLDSDGIDFSREEDPRMQATVPAAEREARDERSGRDERLPELEAECAQAAAVDQPSQRSRSEVYIGPENR